jgi:hypothetical protein
MAGPRNAQAVKSVINEIDSIGRFCRRYRAGSRSYESTRFDRQHVKQRREANHSTIFRPGITSCPSSTDSALQPFVTNFFARCHQLGCRFAPLARGKGLQNVVK